MVITFLTVFCLLSIITFAQPLSMKKSSPKISGILDKPLPASDPFPEDNAVNVSLSVNLSWVGIDPDGDDLTYNIFFGTSITIPNVEVVWPTETYNPGLLEYNTQYYWRIDSYADDGASTGPTWTFTTRDDVPPYTPSNPFPNDSSIDVSVFCNLSWTGGDPDGDNVTYDVYFGTDSNPSLYLENSSTTNITLPQLSYSTQYFWKIIAEDDYGYVASGPIWTFTTEQNPPPFIPSNPYPANESEDYPVVLNLSWTGGDPNGDNVTYDVYFGTDANPSLLAENLSNTTYSLPKLDFNTSYFWKINAIDSYDESILGPLWTFKTELNVPPYIPTNPIPKNNATNVYTDAILSWTGGDPNNENVTYDVYFGTSMSPPLMVSNTSETSYQPSKMNITTVYYWCVVAWDEWNHSTSSMLWNFKTSIYNNSPPQKPIRPTGPTVGKPGVSYSYATMSVDSNGEPVFYKFDWDDGSVSDWIGPYDSGQTITLSHVWDDKGSYAIKVKAKDIYGGESFWSDPLPISMPKQKIFSNPLFFRLVETSPQFRIVVQMMFW
ncbi:MAG: hypothetical protein KGY50_03655 [Candidatus Thermoplasmatota archaeon]|nr:hypothetical protein [Candidatus Thermoplasmatota archaeon]